MDSNWDHIKNVMSAKHLYSICDQPNIYFHQLCFLPRQIRQGVYRVPNWVAVTTWGGKCHDMNFPSRELIFPIIPTAHECTGSYEPRWQEIPVSMWAHDSYTLQERRLKMSFFICWLYILFPPKNSINHTDLQNTSVQKTSTQEGDAFGICHTDWLTYTFEFSPLSAHSARVFFSPILLVKVPFRCNRGSVHLATVSLSEECWMKLFAQA